MIFLICNAYYLQLAEKTKFFIPKCIICLQRDFRLGTWLQLDKLQGYTYLRTHENLRIVNYVYTVTTNGRHSGWFCFDSEQVEIHCSEEGCQFPNSSPSSWKKLFSADYLSRLTIGMPPTHMNSDSRFITMDPFLAFSIYGMTHSALIKPHQMSIKLVPILVGYNTN